MAGTVDTGATGEARRAAFAAGLRERVLPLRAQAEVRNDWLRQRLEAILPELLAREGFDMWIVAAREYNEDPVIMTLLPEPAMAARRRTILVFSRRPDGGVDRFTLDRYGFGDFYAKGWDPDAEEQDDALARLVRERDPQAIGLNISETFAFGDGLTHQEYTQVMAALGPTYGDRVHGAERLCVGWLERRIPAELAVYPDLVALGHDLIAEMFSPRTIRPGITTTEDVVWWLRQTMQDAGLRAWFQPSISIQARGRRFDDKEARRAAILPGDVLHCDVGFYSLGLATDQQQHAYVLRPGEVEAPAGLRAALAAANRLQEIHLAAMAVGRTGNEVLHAALAQAREEGLTPSIYSHPLGYHGHAAGPTIGLWDHQEGVPGRGDYAIFDDTCYSIELNARHPVPEWDGQEVRIALEEDAALTGGAITWLHGRQAAYHLI
ncbi:MAG TPA: M24 family metallopeptidase [Thermomicrobiales bacterium]|nr:M24 family metallopeptidase [Thermomicrobiales bacterium]